MKKSLFFIFFHLLFYFSMGQENPDQSKGKQFDPIDSLEISQAELFSLMNSGINESFVPPSPHAASIGRYGGVPVGLFTGTIQYEIPLYVFNTRNFSFPINLGYSSNGLQVDKIAGWNGLDWSLEAGGVINRYQKGKHDKVGQRPVIQNWNSMNYDQRLTYLEGINMSPTDLQPDIFTYCFPGGEGKFVIDENGNPLSVPYSNVKIETNTTGTEFNYFNITTPDGVVYKFLESAYTSYPSSESRPNSWYLSKIVHPEGDSITFNYQTVSLTQYLGLSRSVSLYLSGDVSYYECPLCPKNAEIEINTPVSYVTVKYLNYIDFHGYGKVYFDKSQSRQDSYQDYKLDKIRIINPDGSLVKAYSFHYKFPISNLSWQSPQEIGSGAFDNYRYRMFLDSLQLIGSTNQRIGSYIFEYHNLELLPSRFSYAQDHWNYFNGKYNNDLLQLNKVPYLYTGLFSGFVGSNTNRSADSQYSQVGMLKKITYPTRGYTTIEYEGHKNSYGGQLGGCRVLRTKSYSIDNPLPEVKKYIYGNVQSTADSSYYREYLMEIGCTQNPAVRIFCRYGKLSSNTIYNIFYAGNSHVCYGKVEVLDGENAENGKEIHYFDTQMDAPGTPINGQQVTPIAYSNTGWMNGTHTLTEVYNASNVKVRTERQYPKYNETRNYKAIQCLAINFRWNGPWVFSHELLSYLDVVPYEIKSVWAYTHTKETIQHESNGDVKTTTAYTYTNPSHGMLSSDQHVNSDGRTVLNMYYYPHDYDNVQNFGILKNKHLIGRIIDSRSYSDGVLISGTQYKYNDLGQISQIFKAEPPSATNVAFSTGNPYKFSLKETYTYYPAGNLKDVSRTNGFGTTFLWDNTGVNLMAIVEVASSSQVGYLNGKSCTYDSAELYNAIKPHIRANTSINTYTHKHNTGIVKHTDPSGVSTYYEYDSFGRLSLIKNHEGHFLQKFEYRFANQ